MSQTVLAIEEIVSDPNVRRGLPIIKGTGIRVIDLVAYHTSGEHLSAEELAASFQLDLGQVHAALAYYHLNKREAEASLQHEIEEADRLAEELEKQGRLIRLD